LAGPAQGRRDQQGSYGPDEAQVGGEKAAGGPG